MTLMDYCMQYIGEIMDGKRAAPEGVTLTETDPMRRSLELMQKAGDIPTLVRMCAAQDGTELSEELFTESGDLGGFELFLQNADKAQEAPAAEKKSATPDPDANKHAFEVFLDCIAMDDGLVQYLIDVLKRMDRKEFFKLSQITTKLDLDPEEFLYWLGRRETYADEEEQGCAAAMDHALLRLADEGRLDVVAALLSGDRNTFETFRCEAPELMHAPIATFEWYEKNYLDRDYPIRLIMRLNGVQFPN